MNIEHEDVVCSIFPYTFEGKASTWYFYLREGSITNWNDFEITFTKKFRDDKSTTVPVLELSRVKMDAKEKVKDFNQILLPLMNKIHSTSNPVDDVSIEFYTSALSVSMAMFVKRFEKSTLDDTFKKPSKW